MTPEDLRSAEAAYRAAFAHSEQLREHRNALVRQAIEQGWTHAQIAQTTGLTRTRVGQIALSR